MRLARSTSTFYEGDHGKGKLEALKRASVAQLLFKSARLLNDYAIAQMVELGYTLETEELLANWIVRF